jgi:hypothetical protein
MLDFFKTNPTATRSEFKKKHQALYGMFWRNDRIWFDRHAPSSEKKPYFRKDWSKYYAKKDKDLLPKIKKAAFLIKQKTDPLQLVSSRAVGKFIGCCLNSQSLRQLPLCKQALSEICEDWRQFNIRKLENLTRRYIAEGILPTPTRYRYHFLCAYKKLPRFRTLMDAGYQRIKDALLGSSK